ncbi:hypothetical protein MLD38_015696 [Melastoma candidum]|uniref:Uncharacterized protein n=1 Tax=Melastoma candidum TaxID=119954 RepID=A0ACB9RIV9_9MYRT|nr:hypothetical protein MLD38_015696 [Melastoma candidum]
MENMQYAEDLVREFLAFRGFTSTLQAFETDLASEIGRGFQVDKLMELVFSVYVPKLQAERLVELFGFFRQCLSSSVDTVLFDTLSRLETSILRYYIVSAVKSGRRDKVVDFFGANGNDLMLKDQEWTPWFAVPYMKNPSTDPRFRVYFSKEWYEALKLAIRNFFDEIFNGSRIPTLLKVCLEKSNVSHLKKQVEQLNSKVAQLQSLLEEKETQLAQSRSRLDAYPGLSNSSSQSIDIREEDTMLPSDNHEPRHPAGPRLSGNEQVQDWVDAEKHKVKSEFIVMESGQEQSSSNSEVPHDDIMSPKSKARGSISIEPEREIDGEEEFPEVRVDFQETFLGHTSPITRCRFSSSGDNIASASMDGTVRIWTYDSSTSASRNATIYCGTEIISLDWECKSDRLLLIGTADGGIKAWNVDAKRVVCDLSTSEAFPSVLDVKCSPVEPIFVSAAASRRNGTGYMENLEFASLTVWNMKTWKAMTVLPLGEDPPAITSVCFNHNGKILAASATDGMIHMFDMSAGLQITGWPAHDTPISSILFGADETSIFSLGTDGKVLEWSLQKQGQILSSIKPGRWRTTDSCRNFKPEMALDVHGRSLLVTSGTGRAPIYPMSSDGHGLMTLPHTASITTVDWHPTLPIYLTGSADNSVRVTSML